MSRGPGRVQRAILQTLDGERRWFSVDELARAAYQVEAPTPAQLAAVRRAVRRLDAEAQARTRWVSNGSAPRTYRRYSWVFGTTVRYQKATAVPQLEVCRDSPAARAAYRDAVNAARALLGKSDALRGP